jgi:hypothetical protein
MIEWPAYLSCDNDERLGLTKEDCADKADWPYWRIMLLKHTLHLDLPTHERLSLSCRDDSFYLQGPNLSECLALDDIIWVSQGVQIKGKPIGIRSIFWSKTTM